MKLNFLFAAILIFTVGCDHATKSASTVQQKPLGRPLPATLQEALTSPYRTPANIQRDVYRHPLETLTFFGIKPDMTVIEVNPGDGWYAEILAPYLSQSGQYIAAVGGHGNLNFAPEVKDHVKTIEFDPANKKDWGIMGTADAVLTFRNVHNWMARGTADEAFHEFFKALKPGGVLGVVEHRANPKAKFDPKAKSGYVPEKEVIRLAKNAGFEVDAKSEINANPKDLKNYPQGVWTLPPTLTLGDQNKDRYLKIGESDRMTMRFVKPEFQK